MLTLPQKTVFKELLFIQANFCSCIFNSHPLISFQLCHVKDLFSVWF